MCSSLSLQKLNKLEVRLALVSAKCSNAVIFADPTDLPPEWVAKSKLGGLGGMSRSPEPPQQQHQEGRVRNGTNTGGLQSAAVAGAAGGQETAAAGAESGGLLEPVSSLPSGVILKAVGDSSSLIGKPESVGEEQQQQYTHPHMKPPSLETGGRDGGKGCRFGGEATTSAPLTLLSESATLTTAYSSSLYDYKAPLAVIDLSTANTVMMSALEWGDVMVVKDTVQYFGRNAGLVQDLFISKSATPNKTLVSNMGCKLVREGRIELALIGVWYKTGALNTH